MTRKSIFALSGILISILLVLAGLFLVTSLRNRPSNIAADPYQTSRIVINQTPIFVRIPETEALQEKGLGDLDRMEEDEGMLWRYASPQMVQFWMKDMRFPLDFIWIRDGRVIAINENVPPPTGPNGIEIISPPEPIDRVLEVNAGYVKIHAIEVGATVEEYPT